MRKRFKKLNSAESPGSQRNGRLSISWPHSAHPIDCCELFIKSQTDDLSSKLTHCTRHDDDKSSVWRSHSANWFSRVACDPCHRGATLSAARPASGTANMTALS